MGYLDKGTWRTGRMPNVGGGFARPDSGFRRWIGAPEFPAEAGRYHLFVSLACPWACRAVIVRALKKLDHVIGMTIVDPDMMEDGWTFGGAVEPLTGARFLRDVYLLADPHASGPVTVPVLWDTATRTIVNNESSEIVRMLNTDFDAWSDATLDLYPEPLRADIDAINAPVYATLNNGVYRAGFATDQAVYDEAVRGVFAMLDTIEARLEGRRWLVGDQVTEADVRLFTTVVRFDLVYYAHFKCNLRQLRDYPRLSAWMAAMLALDGVAATVDAHQIKRHYYFSQRWVNPTGIVPLGPLGVA